MTKGFSTGFTHFLAPSDQTLREALTGGMVVLDTNVLLSAYRFAPKAREELLSTLEGLKERLWVPHQVGLEFHRNRLEVMADRRATYDAVLNAIAAHDATVGADLENKIKSLSNRAALIDAERDELLAQLSGVFAPLQASVRRLSNDHAPTDGENEDPILTRLQQIISDHVGDDFDAPARDDAMEEAERRIKEQVPPGFKDGDKPTKHGDYFVWRQTLDEAKKKAPQYLVLVTGDQKEDWYLKVKGKIIGARPELVEEANRVCGVQLVMMNTQSLLYHAKAYLDANVSAETIRQAGELPTDESQLEKPVKLRFRRRHLADKRDFLQAEQFYLHKKISESRARLVQLIVQFDEALTPNELNKLFFERQDLESEIEEMDRRLVHLSAQLADIEEQLEYVQGGIRSSSGDG
ncbi:hypothetical protein IW249_003594 [Micromonospora vinacea]|uniref:PIN like domain-containing protein n=1 Tax=Micromonospora vinacea TaxID=709878 RepID=A0ABS0K3S2_9ACTN|nr:PIN-like domain-containing protein [Micromonospora vinacea]MBG6103180.1 hypothetical protein [Micromonospora vinacea]